MKHQIIQGDCLDTLGTLPDDHFQTCITSPPYWLLRDYETPGQIGLEESLEEYLQALVNVFQLVRRVLRPDGTLWLNLGDCYNKKQLMGLPWRLAFALQADGWWLRSDIVWHKPNPCPEPVQDRPTRAHEFLFLLSPSPKYFYDADAVKEKSTSLKGSGNGFVRPQRKSTPNGNPEPWQPLELRNLRDVWKISSQGLNAAHFATFPQALVEPCIKAGSRPGDHVLDPFGGAGTVGLVADRLGRSSTLLELNPEYIELAKQRIYSDAPLFCEVETK